MSMYAIVSKGGNVLLVRDSITNLWQCPGILEDSEEKLIQYFSTEFGINITLGDMIFSNASSAGKKYSFFEVVRVTGAFKAPDKIEYKWADVTLFDKLDVRINHKIAIMKANSHKLFG